MNQKLSVQSFALTGKCANSLLKRLARKTPFRRGSVIEKAFLFLQKPRTMNQLKQLAEKEGLTRAPGLLRKFRRGILDGESFWLLDETADGKIQLRKVTLGE